MRRRKVFTCYSHDDATSLMIIQRLRNAPELDVWYDDLILPGDDWWKAIAAEIAACDIFVYFASPHSNQSPYCQKELALAFEHSKTCIPVLVASKRGPMAVPIEIERIHWLECGRGRETSLIEKDTEICAEDLIRATLSAELNSVATLPLREAAEGLQNRTLTRPAIRDIDLLVSEGNFDDALRCCELLIDEFQGRNLALRKAVEKKREKVLMHRDKRDERRKVEREYQLIYESIQNHETREYGCKAFRDFKRRQPNFDPLFIERLCSHTLSRSSFKLPLLDWITIPSGEVKIAGSTLRINYNFQLGKYPVTNAQFNAFLHDRNGYQNSRCWNFSKAAAEWHDNNPVPVEPKFKADDHPRQNVNWYEAMAFCSWLSQKAGLIVSLPKAAERIRATQGDDGRIYPWGNDFDSERCNTRENLIRSTTRVNRYENGASPFGIIDLSGNVWEWLHPDVEMEELKTKIRLPKMPVLGGGWRGRRRHARAYFAHADRYWRELGTEVRLPDVGFRVCTLPMFQSS